MGTRPISTSSAARWPRSSRTLRVSPRKIAGRSRCTFSRSRLTRYPKRDNRKLVSALEARSPPRLMRVCVCGARRAAARTGRGGSLRQLLANWTARWRGEAPDPVREDAVVQTVELRELIQRAVDFERVNSGAVRLVLGAVNLVTKAETYFINDRHVIGLDHVLASTAFPGLPPVVIDRQRYGGSAVSVAALDEARPADTLCFVIDGYDPVPGARGGISRSAREIAALRRNHDLRRMIALVGERVPPVLQGNAD